jgi:hypothetical protein
MAGLLMMTASIARNKWVASALRIMSSDEPRWPRHQDDRAGRGSVAEPTGKADTKGMTRDANAAALNGSDHVSRDCAREGSGRRPYPPGAGRTRASDGSGGGGVL